ncbi:tetratricopeptide repeat-containing sensor histidine kinase [Niabella ginsengisoli]|uniref:Tetratricopeptide repeat protein n=1 Tax=Niabella ginsengisoli TaxID=522298 RepID=A0ABS9SIZ3_9BACT|nr:tetratricopeptide repeat-containing sensor histidine kinase [Niabella ginsengisoli]MCH5598343.1 tetratricopeptide repeat protein [Niabella ginsengisoli]
MPDNKVKVDSILSYVEKNWQDVSRGAMYEEAFRLVDRLKYKEVEPLLYNSYGFFKRELSEYNESIGLHIKALELAKKQDNIHEEIKAYNNLGVAYRRMDDYNNALDYLMSGLKLSEKTGDDYSVTIALNSIGNIHLAQGNYRAAIDYFQQCMPIAIKAKNERGIAINLQNMGECYDRLSIEDSAKIYYNKALQYNQRRKDNKGIAICYNSLGNLLQKKGRLKEALSLYEKALPINIKIGDKIFIANSYNNIAGAHLQNRDYLMAKQMYDSSLQISTAIGSVAEAKNAYQGLMKTAEAQNQFQQAYTFSNLYKSLSDSIINIKNAQSLRGKEVAYHQDKIALLEKDDRNKTIIMVGSLILFCLLLISGILYYLRNRLLERNRSLQRELEIRSQIASDLHDDMGSSLSSIHIFSELLRRKNGNDSQDLLTKIEANAKDTLEALDDIIWLVKPSNDKFSNLSMHIREFSIPLFESKDICFDIDFPDAISEAPLPMETRRNIFLIIKESVNNLVKYAECTEASIKASYDGSDLCFIIKDNGKGFDPAKLTNRNGLKNLKARASQINAEIQINAAPGKGTEIILIVRAKELTVLHAV